MNEGTHHITLDRIVDLLRGHLPPAEQQSIRTHVAHCPHCAKQQTRIERLLMVTAGDVTEDVPQHITSRAVRLMGQRKPAPPVARRRITATLRFDSARMPAAPGRRSQLTGTRQLVFETGLYDIDVRLKPAGVEWSVWGQILGNTPPGEVELHGPTIVQSELTSLGEFHMPPVPPGSYALTLRFEDIEIIMALDIEAR